jgi:ABC-type Fe3+ transport system permease subunit
VNLTTDEIRDFCKLETHDDDLIAEQLGEAAENLVQKYLRRDMQVDFPTAWPAPCKVAALIICLALYDDRSASFESTGAAVLPLKVRALLAPYRVFS